VADRVPILVNQYEREVDEKLRALCQRYGYRVHAKVGIRDVVPIRASGLSDDDYGYALKAHFDFVVTGPDDCAVIAVEFDERHHFTDPAQIARDERKNRIAAHFHLPLVRAGAPSLRQADHRTLLEWLLEVFLEGQRLRAQQAAHDAGGDEPPELDPGDFNYRTSFEIRDGDWSFVPHDAFAHAREKIGLWQSLGIFRSRRMSPALKGWYGKDARGRDVGRIALEVEPGLWLSALGRCGLGGLWPYAEGGLYPPIVAQDLALLDLARQLDPWDRGETAAISSEGLEKLTDGLKPGCLTWPKAPSRSELALAALELMRASGAEIDEGRFLISMTQSDDEREREYERDFGEDWDL
jgi:hypothetical protein